VTNSVGDSFGKEAAVLCIYLDHARRRAVFSVEHYIKSPSLIALEQLPTCLRI